MTTCHRHPDGHRVLRTHERDCHESGCEGCSPCPERHCGCGRHLQPGDLHCPRCVGEVREDVQRISDLCLLTSTAATERPTLTMLDIAGPVADRPTYNARHNWAVKGGLCRCVTCPDTQPRPHGPACEKCAHHTCKRIRWEITCPDLVAWLDHADDERHPLWVLGTWDMLVTEHLSHTRSGRVTVASAAGYLTANLTDLSRDPDFGFSELAREVRDCRAHVEEVLAVADHVERGAPCPVCHASERRAKPLEREFGDTTTDEDGNPDHSGDVWVCPHPACSQEWTMEEYERYVKGEYVARADRLTASQIAATYRVAEGTVRVWAARGKVRKRGSDGFGRQLYDVADTLEARGDMGVAAG